MHDLVDKPLPGQKLPAGHEPAAGAAAMPIGQCAPASQGVPAVRPVVAQKRPAVHCVPMERAVDAQKRPTVQTVAADKPVLGTKCPTGAATDAPTAQAEAVPAVFKTVSLAIPGQYHLQ